MTAKTGVADTGKCGMGPSKARRKEEKQGPIDQRSKTVAPVRGPELDRTHSFRQLCGSGRQARRRVSVGLGGADSLVCVGTRVGTH